MKKLNNFILFPLLLGGVCLVCGGAVAGINMLVAPKIAGNATSNITSAINSAFANNKGITLVYDSTSDDSSLNTNEKPFNEQIIRYYTVATSDDRIGYAYHLTTTRGYSGNIEFVACIFENSVIGLRYIGGDEDTLGVNAVNTLASYINRGNEYASGTDYNSFVVSSGASAKQTFPVLFNAINIAISDIGNRLSFEFSNNLSVTIKDEGYDYVTYEVHSSHGVSDDFGDDYKEMKGEFTYSYSLRDTSYKLSKIEITEKPATSEDDYGDSILSGTASDPFTTTFVAPAISGDGVSFSLLNANVASLANDTRYITSNSKALATTYTLYSMIYESAQQFATYNKTTSATTKIDDTHYKVRYFAPVEQPYGNLEMTLTINETKDAFLGVEFNDYSAVAYYDNFGLDIIQGNTNSSNDNRNEFVTNYVKFPATGLPFTSIKTAHDTITDDEFKTGATQTTHGYIEALYMLVTYIEGGN